MGELTNHFKITSLELPRAFVDCFISHKFALSTFLNFYGGRIGVARLGLYFSWALQCLIIVIRFDCFFLCHQTCHTRTHCNCPW